MDADIITLPIAAQRLGVSREIAMRLVLRGELEGELIAGRWLLSRRSVEACRQERAQRAQGSARGALAGASVG